MTSVTSRFLLWWFLLWWFLSYGNGGKTNNNDNKYETFQHVHIKHRVLEFNKPPVDTHAADN